MTTMTRGVITNVATTLKRLLTRAQTDGFMRMLEDDSSYLGNATNSGQNVFRMSDLDIRIGYERIEEVPDTDANVLKKPLLVFDAAYNCNVGGIAYVDATTVGMQLGLYVNAKPLGRLYLDGYAAMLESFLKCQCNYKAADQGLYVRGVDHSPVGTGSLAELVSSEFNDRVLCCFVDCDLVYFASEVKLI